MNCVVIDENIEDLKSLVTKINLFPNLHLVGQFSNYIDAKHHINQNPIDIIIIDINNNHESCFSFLDTLTKNTKIIFTSHDTQFAFRTFNYNCIDYLKKPISNNRFKKTVNKLNNLSQKNNGNHIYVKSKLKKKKIYLTNIKWIEALGDYIRLITNSENVVMLSSLKSFEQELPKGKFMRIHKSYIVNLEKIETYDSKNVFIGSEKIPLSRNKKVDLDSALTLKIN